MQSNAKWKERIKEKEYKQKEEEKKEKRMQHVLAAEGRRTTPTNTARRGSESEYGRWGEEED